MKSILIMYGREDWRNQQPLLTNDLNKNYNIWGQVAKRHKVELLRSCIYWFNGQKFIKYWRFNKENKWTKCKRSILPTIVYDKAKSYHNSTSRLNLERLEIKHQLIKVVSTVNIPQFSRLIDNKLYQTVIFDKWMPESRLMRAGEIIKNPSRHRIVIKKTAGVSGAKIFITNKKIIKIKQLSIEQDFVDYSKKEPARDYRIVFMGSKPQYVTSRVAREGSFFTNERKGGNKEVLKLKDVKDLIEISKHLIKPLKVFPKYLVGFDFMRDAKKKHPFLVAAHSVPRVEFDEPALLEKYYENLTSYLLEK